MLLLPPEIVAVDRPVIFLAGPIQVAPDWQSWAARWFQEQGDLSGNGDLAVASPRRLVRPDAFEFAAQVDWESHYLRLAAERGVILFWLACEVTATPGRSYAQTTRFELAEWKTRHQQSGVPVVVGIEPGFNGERYIRYRLAQECPTIPVLATLEETCRAALSKLP